MYYNVYALFIIYNYFYFDYIKCHSSLKGRSLWQCYDFSLLFYMPLFLLITAALWVFSVPNPRVSFPLSVLLDHNMEIGTRVLGCLQVGGSAYESTFEVRRVRTKLWEVWVMVGLGHRLPPSRCKQAKCTWKRVCRRAVRDGHTQYRGKVLWAYEVPICFRVFVPNDDPPKFISKPRIVSTASDPRIFSWNAGNGLVYDEQILRNDQSGYDILLIQEIGWIFSNQ